MQNQIKQKVINRFDMLFSNNHLKLTIMKTIIDLWHVERSGNKSQLIFFQVLIKSSQLFMWRNHLCLFLHGGYYYLTT